MEKYLDVEYMIKIKVQMYDMALAVLFCDYGHIKSKEYMMLNERKLNTRLNSHVLNKFEGMCHVDDAIHYMTHTHTHTHTHIIVTI